MTDSWPDIDTLAARPYTDGRRENRPLSLPIVRATTFEARSAEQHRRLFIDGDTTFYQRFANPTSAAAGAKVAELEGAEAGIVFGSGMGAVTTSLLAVLRAGDHIVLHREVFAQTETFVKETLAGLGVEHTVVDARNPADIAAALRPTTRLVYVETPSNPLLHIIPLRAIAEIVRARGIELFVDSTFASPYLQQPLAAGATLVLHSGTKYLGGHSDVMCGAAAGRRELIARLRRMQILVGSVLDPQGAWLLLRGIKTLAVRVERQAASALAIARFLDGNPQVSRVRYPWLESDPGHAVAREQMRGGGGVVSFEVRGGRARARRMLDSLRGIPIATSLGGVETVIELPYDLDFEEDGGDGAGREHVPELIRLSVGLERVDELIDDLGAALEASAEVERPRVATTAHVTIGEDASTAIETSA